MNNLIIKFKTYCMWLCLMLSVFKFKSLLGHLTYMRVSNFGQNIDPKMTIWLICGSTYTRVYTVHSLYDWRVYKICWGCGNSKQRSTNSCSSIFWQIDLQIWSSIANSYWRRKGICQQIIKKTLWNQTHKKFSLSSQM